MDLDRIINKLEHSYMKAEKFCPVEFNEKTLVIAVSGAGNEELTTNLQAKLDCPVTTREVSPSRLERLLGELEEKDDTDKGRYTLSQDTQGVIPEKINTIIADAVRNGASDIHFEPREDGVVVRFRRDGVLHDIRTLPKNALPSITSRVKIMADLDIAEKRQPQDGRINIRAAQRDVDVRLSIVPTVHGERIVMRLLGQDDLRSELDDLGMLEDEQNRAQSILKERDGIVLATGPTGSGKTTTLYCFMQQLPYDDLNVITIEDPVEYQLDGFNQIEVDPEYGVGFAQALRSVLRQDPDVIFVGEIRDQASANLAVHAALTGHLVFSTLHTRNAIGTIDRLHNMGVERHLIGASLRAVLAQRLVRTLCPNCRVKQNDHYRPGGCSKCMETGYQGRTGIFEFITINEKIQGMIEEGESTEAIRRQLRNRGQRSLQQSAQKIINNGKTDPGEVKRVLGE